MQKAPSLLPLFLFCAAWGIGGAFISLQLSRKIAIWTLRVKLLNTSDHFLSKIVEKHARASMLPCTPKIGIFPSSSINAFATGPSKRRSLVAVSTELLNRLDEDAIDAIVAHEITHIANGDMVTLTLIQGVINTFVLFFARIIAYVVSTAIKSRNETFSYIRYYILTLLFEFVLMIFGSMIVAKFSRWREFRADHGGATLTSHKKMIHALELLQQSTSSQGSLHKNKAFNSMMIANTRRKKTFSPFATHPSLEKRIAKLKESYSC